MNSRIEQIQTRQRKELNSRRSQKRGAIIVSTIQVHKAATADSEADNSVDA
jgi:hypothetical protein